MTLISRRSAAWFAAACVSIFFATVATPVIASTAWQTVRSTVALRGMATDGSIYVGAAPNGIWTSTDMVAWQRAGLPDNAGVYYNDVIYANGEFIAVGNSVVTSTDGKTWSVRYTPNSGERLVAITFANGIYIAVGDDGTHLLRSTDGHAWSSIATGLTPASSQTAALNGVASDGSTFVIPASITASDATGAITSAGSEVLTSADGLSWTQHAVSATYGAGFDFALGNSAAWGNGTFVAAGLDDLYTSTDANTWTDNDITGTGAMGNPPFWLMDRVTFSGGQFIATGVDEEASGNKAAIFTSPNGTNWSASKLEDRGASLFGMSFALKSNSTYYAGGYLGIYASTDLTTWSKVFTGPQTNVGSCIIQGGGKFVAPGYYGALTSTDGITWPDTLQDSALRADVHGLGCGSFGANVYVTINNNNNEIDWSSDGKSWTEATSSRHTYLQGVAFDGSKFVAVGSDVSTSAPFVITSTDGKNWTDGGSVDIGATKVQFGGGYYAGGGLAYLNKNWVAWGEADGAPFIATSLDGSKWSLATGNFPADLKIHAIAYGDGQFIAIGNTADGSSIVMSSADASNWQKVATQIAGMPSGTSTAWNTLVWNGSQFMAGGGVTDVEKAAFLSSADGVNWSFETNDETLAVSDLVWDGSQYVAVGNYDILQYAPPVAAPAPAPSPSPAPKTTSSSSGGGGALGLLGLFALLGMAAGRKSRLR